LNVIFVIARLSDFFGFGCLSVFDAMRWFYTYDFIIIWRV